ncbi:MAG: diguanylate cyclase [Oculatellaceae cyanobacterium Prado106]|jgi:diguanylate cyclase (GGDEF)-like protein|nr:diguanylate cyclase [Oculatellaceae cyanobacterium Prado106]
MKQPITAADPPLILVVDDDRFVRFQLRQTLEEEGYRVEEASNGKEGLEAYTRLQPSMVLLDAVMPVMDGFDCCAQLQKLQLSHVSLNTPGLDDSDISDETEVIPRWYAPMLVSTPILMITGLEDQQSVDQAFEVGAADYITKPIHLAVLRRRVRRLLEQSQLYRQLEDANQKLEEVNHALQRLASVDGLTQVANRRCFDETFVQEWQRLSRENCPLALILLDIDYFKRYNDTYGHLAGDRCLKQVAQAISYAVRRPSDLVSRYGGEEFAILLPNTTLTGAGLVAEEIRVTVKHLDLEHSSSPLNGKLTVSLGIASLVPHHSQSPTVLINTADKALYLAKETGRDRACLLTP